MAYPTLADFKAFMDIPSIYLDEDALLTGYLEAAISWVQRFCARNFVAQFEVRVFGALDATDGGDFLLRIGEFTTVSEIRTGRTDGELIPPADYRLIRFGPLGYPYEAIELVAGASARSFFKAGLCTVSAMWGFSNDCPPAVRQAILNAAEGQYRRRKSRVAGVGIDRANATLIPQAATPPVVLDYLLPYVRYH